MKAKYLVGLSLLMVLFQSAFAGLPSSDQLRALKESAKQEMAKYFRIQNSLGKCLEVVKAQAKQHGGKVQFSACGTGANQKWILDGAQVKLASGKCLEPAGKPGVAGGGLHIANCNNAAKQKWRYEKEQLLTPANTCVALVAADLKKNGGRVQIAKCNGKQNQKWKPLK